MSFSDYAKARLTFSMLSCEIRSFAFQLAQRGRRVWDVGPSPGLYLNSFFPDTKPVQNNVAYYFCILLFFNILPTTFDLIPKVCITEHNFPKRWNESTSKHLEVFKQMEAAGTDPQCEHSLDKKTVFAAGYCDKKPSRWLRYNNYNALLNALLWHKSNRMNSQS